MLRTNSKKARENLRAYIADRFDPSGYPVNQQPETFAEMAQIILETFAAEKCYSTAYYGRYTWSDQNIFANWCAGLPSILDTLYFYNRSAAADLGAILEESPEEISRYNESDAEKRLTYLIFRELMAGVAK
jgi:hypothetical protein